MNSKGLEPWQVRKLFDHAQRELHYLNCLEGRMRQKHFPADDPLHMAVWRARVAVADLAVELDRLQR